MICVRSTYRKYAGPEVILNSELCNFVLFCFLIFYFVNPPITLLTTIQRPSFLDPGGVEHDPHASAHGLGRKVLGELGADGAGVSVGAGDLAPDDPHVGLLGLVGDGSLLLGLEIN